MVDSCFISLGCDCSVSYQLRRLGLQTRGTMPFDWMRIDNLHQVISILEAEFCNFASFESYTIKKQSLAFNYFDSDLDSDLDSAREIKSQYKMIHKNYKFILPHEYKSDYLDRVQFEAKYARRIERFLEIGRNPALPKVFVRLGSARDASKLARLQTALDDLGCVNYKVQYISLEDYESLIPKDETFKWQRDYLPFDKILLLSIKSRISSSIICSSRGDNIKK